MSGTGVPRAAQVTRIDWGKQFMLLYFWPLNLAYVAGNLRDASVRRESVAFELNKASRRFQRHKPGSMVKRTTTFMYYDTIPDQGDGNKTQTARRQSPNQNTLTPSWNLNSMALPMTFDVIFVLSMTKRHHFVFFEAKHSEGRNTASSTWTFMHRYLLSSTIQS